MNIVIILAILAVVVFVGWIWGQRFGAICCDTNFNMPASLVCGAGMLLAVLTISTVISTMNNYSDQLADSQKLVQLRGVQEVRLTQATALTTEFRQTLADKYPEHEKAIFRNFNPQSMLAYLVNYPQLQALSGMQDLVKRTQELWSGYYGVQEEQQALLATMRFRAIDPWLLNWFIPNPPE